MHANTSAGTRTPSRVRVRHERQPRRTAAEEPPAAARAGAGQVFSDADPLAEDRDAAAHGSLPPGPILDGNRRHRFLVALEDRTIHRGTPLSAGSRSVRLYDIGRGRIPGRRERAAFQPDARVVEPGVDVRGVRGGRLPRRYSGPGCFARRTVRPGRFPRCPAVGQLLCGNRSRVRRGVRGRGIRGGPPRVGQLPGGGRVRDLAGVAVGLVDAASASVAVVELPWRVPLGMGGAAGLLCRDPALSAARETAGGFGW